MGLRTRWLVCGLTMLAMATTAWAEDDPPWNVTFKPGWDNCYRPERWMPLAFIVQVPKLKKPVACILGVAAQQDSMTNMMIDHEFVVTPELPANVPMVVKVRYEPSKFDVTIRDDSGRERWSAQVGSYSSLEAVPIDDLFIGLVRGGGPTGLPLLDKHLVLHDTRTATVHIKEKVLNMLPWDWAGYDCLDLLILHDLDWNQLNEVQARAIVAWVNNGGQVLIVLGSHPLPREHVLAKMLPFGVGPAREVTLTQSQLSQWNMSRAVTQRTVTCWTLPDTKGWKKLTLQGGQTYFASGLVGFGKVGVTAFTPSEIVQADPAGKFWSEILREYGRNCSASGSSGEDTGDTSDNTPSGYSGYGNGYDLGETATNANMVVNHLMSIPEMRPLSIWWIIGLLTVLAVVLGPLDYFVLKKLDRLPLTWGTSAAVIVLFSVGAYYGVERIRGGLMQVRAVTVTDAVQGQPNSYWSTTMCGIFAPASDSYRLAGPKGNQWWSALSPTRGRGEYYSSYDRQDASRNLYCRQSDGGNIPTAVPINIWSMQCLLAESQPQSFPINAKVEWISSRELKVTLENRSDTELSEAFVRIQNIAAATSWATCWMKLGSVAPHSTAQFTGQTTPIDNSTNVGLPDEVLRATLSQGALPRTTTISQYHQQGGATVYALFKQTLLSFTVENRPGNVNHVQIVRLVVPNVAILKGTGND